MKLTFEDLVGAHYSPHTTKGKEGHPLGDGVLLSTSGVDIGEALISGNFESDDPFVQLMAEVLADTMNSPFGVEPSNLEES